MTEEDSIVEALKGLQSENAKTRDQYFYTLLAISEGSPEQLYPAWDILVNILRKPEVSNKYVAIHLLSNLVRVDTEERFEQIVDEFYQLISHESPVVSPHITGTSGKIIRAKPHLQPRITSLLLNIDNVNRCRHPELLKSYVIQAFDDCFEAVPAKEQEQVIEFVKGQIDSESPITRKKAKEFLKKWETDNQDF